jgi:hypothetical protein
LHWGSRNVPIQFWTSVERDLVVTKWWGDVTLDDFRDTFGMYLTDVRSRGSIRHWPKMPVASASRCIAHRPRRSRRYLEFETIDALLEAGGFLPFTPAQGLSKRS